MIDPSTLKNALAYVSVNASMLALHLGFADSNGVIQVDTFIRSIIKVVGGLAGLIAALFFVIGGYQYMSSSGSPDRMERAKRTLVHAGVGLSIVIGAFVIANIVSGLASSAFGN